MSKKSAIFMPFISPFSSMLSNPNKQAFVNHFHPIVQCSSLSSRDSTVMSRSPPPSLSSVMLVALPLRRLPGAGAFGIVTEVNVVGKMGDPSTTVIVESKPSRGSLKRVSPFTHLFF